MMDLLYLYWINCRAFFVFSSLICLINSVYCVLSKGGIWFNKSISCVVSGIFENLVVSLRIDTSCIIESRHSLCKTSNYHVVFSFVSWPNINIKSFLKDKNLFSRRKKLNFWKDEFNRAKFCNWNFELNSNGIQFHRPDFE